MADLHAVDLRQCALFFGAHTCGKPLVVPHVPSTRHPSVAEQSNNSEGRTHARAWASKWQLPEVKHPTLLAQSAAEAGSQYPSPSPSRQAFEEHCPWSRQPVECLHSSFEFKFTQCKPFARQRPCSRQAREPTQEELLTARHWPLGSVSHQPA